MQRKTWSRSQNDHHKCTTKYKSFVTPLNHFFSPSLSPVLSLTYSLPPTSLISSTITVGVGVRLRCSIHVSLTSSSTFHTNLLDIRLNLKIKQFRCTIARSSLLHGILAIVSIHMDDEVFPIDCWLATFLSFRRRVNRFAGSILSPTITRTRMNIKATFSRRSDWSRNRVNAITRINHSAWGPYLSRFNIGQTV